MRLGTVKAMQAGENTIAKTADAATGGVVYGAAEEALWAEEGGSKSPAGRVHVTFPDGLERTYWFQSYDAAVRFVDERRAG